MSAENKNNERENIQRLPSQWLYASIKRVIIVARQPQIK